MTLKLLVGNLLQVSPICKHFETIYCAQVAPSNPPHAEKQHNTTSYPFPSIMSQHHRCNFSTSFDLRKKA